MPQNNNEQACMPEILHITKLCIFLSYKEWYAAMNSPAKFGQIQFFLKKKIITNTTHANKPVGYCMSKLCRKNSKNSAMNKTLLLHFYYINVNFLPLTIFLNNVLQLQ